MQRRKENEDMMRMRRSGSHAITIIMVALLVHSTAGQELELNSEDSGWYFTETEIGIPFRPTDFQPGANIVNVLEEVVAFCPFGFVSQSNPMRYLN